MISRITFIFLLSIITGNIFSQNTSVSGRVFDNINNEGLPFANVVIEQNNLGTVTDLDGNFIIDNLEPGTYNILISTIGYKTKTLNEIRVLAGRSNNLEIPMEISVTKIEDVEIKASPLTKKIESPLSLRTITATEIFRSPGANRDISKVVASLPGVASSVSFRNDIIVRGGAPNENRFYLDGIEVPNINHFATQGSSGGPVGLINVNFIREVDFYAGAFAANRGNALSSVMELKQIEGNKEKLEGSATVGSSDFGITLNGPVGKKSSFILSVRRSYLQLLFKAFKLPFLPNYYDFQYKHSIQIDKKNKLTIIGLGAIDDFSLNAEVNDGITDTATLELNNYILGNIPVSDQWNYAIGAKWQHFKDNSYQTYVVSRNQLNNSAIKYEENIEVDSNIIYDYTSQEIENKFRFENTSRQSGWKLNYGLGFENVLYTNSTYLRIGVGDSVAIRDFDSRITFNKYALFGQASRSFANERLSLSLGIRTDFSDYDNSMVNPIEQLSPRISVSYALAEKWSLNANTGIYYQLPPYTVLGFRSNTGALQNKANNVTYIRSSHFVSGVEYRPGKYSKVTVEGFFKLYNNYPFLLKDSISLANLGADFGVIGNEPVVSTSDGRSYGVELLIQQTLAKNVFGILSYTFVGSEFKDKQGEFRPSAWDNRHILNITAGYKFKRNWEIGAKFRYLGGAPYTPFNIELSSLQAIYDVTNQGIPDYNRLNEARIQNAHGLDIRVDKVWNFKKWSLNAYLDIENLYNQKAEGPPFLNARTDQNGNRVPDPANPLAYDTYLIQNLNGTTIPSVGIQVEF